MVQWGPPLKFFNRWLLNSECDKVIDQAISGSKVKGWAGFVLCSKLRAVKESVKKWHSEAEIQRKELKNKAEEIFHAIKTLGRNKALGPDGLLLNFSLRSEFY